MGMLMKRKIEDTDTETLMLKTEGDDAKTKIMSMMKKAKFKSPDIGTKMMELMKVKIKEDAVVEMMMIETIRQKRKRNQGDAEIKVVVMNWSLKTRKKKAIQDEVKMIKMRKMKMVISQRKEETEVIGGVKTMSTMI